MPPGKQLKVWKVNYFASSVRIGAKFRRENESRGDVYFPKISMPFENLCKSGTRESGPRGEAPFAGGLESLKLADSARQIRRLPLSLFLSLSRSAVIYFEPDDDGRLVIDASGRAAAGAN